MRKMWRYNILCYILSLIPTLSVADFESTPGSVSGCAGSDVDLTWIFGNIESVTQASWQKNGSGYVLTVVFPSLEVTNTFPAKVMFIENGSIRIKQVDKRDAGTYGVAVYYNISSGIDTGRDNAEVTVLDPPSIPNFTAEGSKYTCHADSYGSPKVEVLIKIGMSLKASNAAVVDFTENVDCCVDGQAVTCMPEASAAAIYCINAITPTGPKNMYLLPPTPDYEVNLEDTLGPIICFATCTPDCTFRWTKGDSTVISNNSKFTYEVTDKDDSGLYTCTATRGAAITDTRRITVYVRYGPDQVSFSPSTSSSYIGNKNETLQITCVSSCYPGCIYRWEKEGFNVTSEPLLTISSLQTSDAGNYTCTVSNAYAGISKSKIGTIDVRVRYGPDTVTLTSDGPNTRNESETLVITCESSCYPGCSYRWEKNGVNFTFGYLLQINNINRSDAGNYTCTATNVYTGIPTSKRVTTEINVRYGPDRADLFPNKAAYIENTGTILPPVSCTSKCYPSCSVTWKKQGEGVVSQLDTVNGLLQLGVLAKNKSGVYICTTSNPQLARIATARVTLSVRYGPDKLRLEPAGPNYVVNEGKPLPNISCSSDCYPGCSQSWSSEIESLEMVKGSVLSLGTAYRNYTGEYTCTSTNEADKYSKTSVQPVNITVHYHPDVTVTQINGTSVTEGIENYMLMCSAKGNPNVNNFTKWIHFAPDGTMIRELNSSFSSKEKAYLKFPNTSYMDSGKYECVVTNGIPSIKTGDIFAKASITQVVKGVPQIFSTGSQVSTAIGSDSKLSISFYSNDGNEPIVSWFRVNGTRRELLNDTERYNINTSKTVETVLFYSKEIELLGKESDLTILYVTPDDIGSYEVQVNNSVGHSSTTFALLPEGPPDTPKYFSVSLNVSTSSSITLTWKSGFHGGANQTFYIEYRRKGSEEWQLGPVVIGEMAVYQQFHVTVNGLVEDTSYEFRIYSRNKFNSSNVTVTEGNTTPIKPDEDPTSSSNVGLIVGGAAGGAALAAVIVVLVILFLRRRQDYLKSPSKSLLKNNERPAGTKGADDTPEINLNPMYESAGPLPSTSNNSDVYSQVDKNRKKANPAGDIYSQVDKPIKRQNAGGSEVKNDVYAQVQKKTQKDKDGGKIKHKKPKPKPDKKTKKGKQIEGDLYDNVDTVNPTNTKGDTVYENPACSIEDEHPKRMRNQDGLIYADLDLPKETVGKARKAVIHGLDDRTDYADIKYGEVGEQALESDEEKTKKE